MFGWLVDEHPVIFCVLVFAALVVGGWKMAESEQRAWDAWAREHHCVVTGREAGQTVITTEGKVGFTSDRTIYRCGGEEIVIR